LDSLKIDHQFAAARGAHHRYDEIIQRFSFDALAFWEIGFAQNP
jgi:hypothetical protein